jgi:hypothetical protein
MQYMVKCESGMRYMTALRGKNGCRGRSWEKFSRVAGHNEQLECCMDDGYAHYWDSTERGMEAIEVRRDVESSCGARTREMVLIVRMADRQANAVPEDEWQDEFAIRVKATQGVCRHMITTFVSRWQYVIVSKISTPKTTGGTGVVCGYAWSGEFTGFKVCYGT